MSLKNKLSILFMFLFSSLFVTANPLEGSFLDTKIEYVQKYMWRGFDLLPDDDPAIQPDLYFSLGDTGFYLGIWGSFALDSKWDIWDEWDFYGGYEFSLWQNEPFSMDINLGYTYFHFPNQNRDTDSQEISFNVKFPQLFSTGPIKMVPYSGLYFSFSAHDHAFEKDQDAVWFKLGISSDIPFEFLDNQPVCFYIETFANDGGGTFKTESGFSHLAFGIKSDFELFGFYIKPSINYQWTFEETVNTEDEFWFTLGIGYVFE